MSRITEAGHITHPALAAGELGAVIRYAADGPELVNLPWGLKPTFSGGEPFTVIRAEGRAFPDHRCLIVASEFRSGKGARRRSFTMVSGDSFYFAGIWQSARDGWPESYAAITIDANPDVEPFHHRMMAVIRRADSRRWLDDMAAGEELLRPLPLGTFVAKRLREGEPDRPFMLE
jgi:putative SOS response-associated peptidase YedK